jgi:hypothetical protein
MSMGQNCPKTLPVSYYWGQRAGESWVAAKEWRKYPEEHVEGKGDNSAVL